MEARTQWDMWNPETWTDDDRAFLDAARKLTEDEKQFMIDILQLMEGHPERAAIVHKYIDEKGRGHTLRTPEGRAELLDMMRATT
jgi:DNA replication initiation complex subunit (GINS family)